MIGLNKMIAGSKEIKEWDLEIKVQPDTCEAKVCERPSIKNPKDQSGTLKLDDTRVLAQAVTQPINFKKWVIFCTENDKANGTYV
jgi:hypothetical protein